MRLLIVLFLIESVAVFIAMIARARWLSLQELGQRGFTGLFREVRSQMSGWPMVVFVALPITWLAILVLAVLGFDMNQ